MSSSRLASIVAAFVAAFAYIVLSTDVIRASRREADNGEANNWI